MLRSGPKVLQPLCGRPMLGYVLDQARALGARRILLVAGHGADEVRAFVEGEGAAADATPVDVVLQEEQNGTGHAVLVCADEIGRTEGGVVVLYGDMPLLGAETVAALARARGDASAAVLTARPDRPRGFGRILRDGSGAFRGVVEERDATEEERALREVNVGVYAFDRDHLLASLPRLTSDNSQGELYLTDVLGMTIDGGGRVPTVELEDERETIGINTLEHLAEARAGIQARILVEHMANGVTIEDPATTYVDHGVRIGKGTHVLPCTVIRAGVEIGEGCEVGPFTHLRVGTVLEDGAEVGNFTEAKKSRVGAGTKAKHLTYLGDVTIGAGANIGAGTIVANYDGKAKHPTRIGDRAFIGSGTILIAPATVGDGALTGAGAVVTRNSEIPPGEAWVGVPARGLEKKKTDN
jgi:bifunctional UDP-N-acetylglucosamine pyrophosphorylase/glucosamine-1-phosphate N-acetyltransferase